MTISEYLYRKLNDCTNFADLLTLLIHQTIWIAERTRKDDVKSRGFIRKLPQLAETYQSDCGRCSHLHNHVCICRHTHRPPAKEKFGRSKFYVVDVAENLFSISTMDFVY